LLILGSLLLACSQEQDAPSTSAPPPSTTTTSTTMSSTTSTTVPEMPQVENLGLAAVWLRQLDGGGVAFGVSESAQGADLNNDGDLDDVVAHLLLDREVVNTGVSGVVEVFAMSDGGVVMQVSEWDAGSDLSGDGDDLDQVPLVWHPDRGVTNLGINAWATPGPDGTLWLERYDPVGERQSLVVWHPDGRLIDTGWTGASVRIDSQGTALIGVFETEQGTDLDGNGDLDDHVLVRLDASGEAEVIGPAYAFDFTADGGVWVSWVDVDEAGSTVGWHLGLWHSEREFVDLPLATVNHTATSDGGLLFRVSESVDYWASSEECVPGSRDLNGDGDCGDFLLHRWSPDRGLVDLGLVETVWCPECDWGYITSGSRAFVSQSELAMGDDLDGDGEITDALVLHAVEGDSVHNLGLPVTWDTRSWAVLESGVIVLVPETSEDLNDDGDLEDNVFHFVSNSGAVTNLGLAGRRAQAVGPEEALLLAEESGNGRDLNGDGHVSDETYVIHLWSLDGGVFNTGITNARLMDEMEGWRPYRAAELSDGRLVVLVSEQQHGHGDLNSDGDTDDLVVHVISSPK
jgi:hypothetical protein